MVVIGRKRSQIVTNVCKHGRNCTLRVADGCKWSQMVANDRKWLQTVANARKCQQTVANGRKRSQIITNSRKCRNRRKSHKSHKCCSSFLFTIQEIVNSVFVLHKKESSVKILFVICYDVWISKLTYAAQFSKNKE